MRVVNCTFGTVDIMKLCVMYLYGKHTNKYWMMQSENKLSLLSFLPSYTVVNHLGTEMSWVWLFFPVKGRDRGTECALLSPCLFELFEFCREAVCFPPIFLKLHDSPAKSNRVCWGPAAPRAFHSCAPLLPHVQVCACVCTLVVLSVLWQNSWRYTFKKKLKKKIK